MRNVGTVVTAVVMSVVFSSPVSASTIVYCTNCADIISGYQTLAQMINQVQTSAQQLQTEYSTLQYAIQNTLSTPSYIANTVIGDWNRVASLYSQASSLSSSLQNLDGVFNARYPGFQGAVAATSNGASMVSNYVNWSSNLANSARDALRVVGMQVSTMQDQNDRISTIQALSSSSTGQMQAIQAGNMMAGSMADQLGKLQVIAMEHLRLQSEYMAQQGTEKAAEAAETKARWGTLPPYEPKRW